MRKIRLLIIPILLACLLMGCATLGIGTSDPSQMTPKQLSTFFMGIYNRQYADYKTQIAMPNLTVDQKKILATRKAVLIQVYPLIATYDLTVASGQPTTKVQEAAIMALLNQLGTLIIK